MKVIFNKLRDNVELPMYKHTNDAGADIIMYEDVVIKPGQNIIPLGFSCIIPPGCVGFLSLRSSWMGKGLICNFVPFDADYSGEWNLIVYNVGDEIIIHKGERICQMLVFSGIMQCGFESIVNYTNNQRHENGMGSSGR